jgi:hypothetical protein
LPFSDWLFDFCAFSTILLYLRPISCWSCSILV